VIDTHGLIGYPVGVGITAAMAKTEARLAAKAASFSADHAERFDEHANTYAAQDADAAQQLGAITF
jgi:hypothetical protein